MFLKVLAPYLSIFQKILDAIIIIISWYLAYLFRFNYLEGAEQGLFILYMQLSLPLSILSIYIFYRSKLYHSMRFTRKSEELFILIMANAQSTLLFVIGLYFLAPEKISRLTLLTYILISSFTLSATRLSYRNLLRIIRKRGFNLRHFIIYGDGLQIDEYINSLKKYKDSGIRIVSWLNSPTENKYKDIPREEIELQEAIEKYNPDSVVVCLPNENTEELKKIFSLGLNELTNLHIIPDFGNALIGHKVEEFNGQPIILYNTPRISSLNLLLKRSFDFTSSLIGCLVISPLLIGIAIGVKISSKGPILFGQIRVGLDGKTFKMWKFRSMRVAGNEVENKEWSNKDNPRKTQFGNFIRKTSLDELPQIFNVLLGQMSLVGPRPERPFFVEKFKNEIPAYMLRHKMKAGMTGLAQVKGWRGDTSIPKRIECDLEYIKNYSILLDIKILFKTFLKGLINKDA